jgi:hypothetical protein
MRRITMGYVVIGLIVVVASLSAADVAQAVWRKLAALGFEAVGDHACTDGITFRLSDLEPRTYTANHVVITSTATLEQIANMALSEIPVNPIKFDNQGTFEDYEHSGYYTVPFSPTQTSGISVTLDFLGQTANPEVPIADCVVADLPAIVSQANNPAIDAGQVAVLTVGATGEATLSYQWYQGISGDTTTKVGEDSPTFTTPALSENTNYWVRVSNSLGSVDSNTVTAVIATSHIYIPSVAKQ